MIGLEALGIRALGGTLPPNITPGDARLALQSLISVDGVMMGFTGIVFGALLSREAIGDRAFNLMVSMVATIVLFLLSVLNAFYGLLAIGATGFTNGELVQPIGFLVYGTSVLFYGLALYLARGYDPAHH